MLDPIERITHKTPVDLRVGHDFRYQLASAFVGLGDTVFDAGCGVGYGAAFIAPRCRNYIGVDIVDVIEAAYRPYGRWFFVDLCAASPVSFPPFDVAICFETIEHVDDPAALIALLATARRRCVCSVPIVPTVGENPFHKHDFGEWDVPELFAPHGWTVEQYVLQPSELSAIYVLVRT